MKKILATLITITLGATVGNLSSVINISAQKIDIFSNQKNTVSEAKTQQNTIYIDNNGKQITTSERDLSDFESKEIIQIGFYKNEQGEIQVVKMPKTIEKVPDQLPSEITSLKKMFYKSSKFNQDISKWDTSNVVDMTYMFSRAFKFNQDISKWDTSHVTNMAGMFAGALLFNQDISKWNTYNVKNMAGMFAVAKSFNQDISKWDTSNVVDMTYMFSRAFKFNQDISKWNVSNVKLWDNFAIDSGITDDNKLPKFRHWKNDILFEKDYRFLAHDLLKIKISADIVQKLNTVYKDIKYEFKNYLFLVINDFPKLDNTGVGGQITQDDIYKAVEIIEKHWNEISNFANKLPTDKGILVVTNTIGSWDKSDNMGVFSQTEL